MQTPFASAVPKSSLAQCRKLHLVVFGLMALACADSAFSANWYVRPGGAGSKTGVDWNNAWDSAGIGWSSTSPGDTIWLAGGTYTGQIAQGKGGSASSYLYVKRVRSTDAAPTAAAGWNSSFDSQVIVTGNQENLYIATAHCGDYTYWDGRVTNGISLRQSNGGGGSSYYNIDIGESWLTSQVNNPNQNILFTNIESVGTYQAALASGGYVIYSTCVGLNAAQNVTFTHCNFHDGLQFVFLCNAANTVFDHSTIYNIKEENSTVGHANLLANNYLGYGYYPNITFSYCSFQSWDNEGLSPTETVSGTMLVYGCWFENSGGWGRAFQSYDTTADATIVAYNNTFVNVNGNNGASGPGVWAAGNYTTSCAAYNNIYWNCTSVPAGFANEDYEYSDVALGEAHSVLGTGASPFVNAAASNFQIVSTIAANYPRQKGTTIANTPSNTFNVDMLGNVRGAGGVAWSIGAFEYGSGAILTNPAISVSPGSLSFGTIASGVTVTNSFTVQNAGGGTLVGTATVPAPFSIVSGGSYSLGSNQSQTVYVSFSPSSTPSANTQNVTFTGGGGTTASVSGQLLSVLPGLSFAPSQATITAPYTLNGSYFSQTVDVSNEGQAGVTAGGSAIYWFMITNAGNYVVSASVNAPGIASKSLWINIDSMPVDPQMIWDIYPFTTGFQTVTASWRGSGTYTNDQYSPQIFNLTAGPHELILVGREANVEVGQISISPYLMPPTNLRIVLGP